MFVENDWIKEAVCRSLEEDLGSQDFASGDITARLIDENRIADAEVIVRESAVVCGIPYFDEVYRQIDPDVRIQWHVKEGDSIQPNQCIVTLGGAARSLVTGERSALNWLQFLSGTATQVARCAKILEDTKTALLDTRKTMPGLRYAQKYAVTIGGGQNHRMGLYDAYLIKENHIASCGSIKKAIERARQLNSEKFIEVEVENDAELEEALNAGADIIMLDNFNVDQMRRAVQMTGDRAKLEVSGNIELRQLRSIAAMGIHFISMGALTKNVRAIDFSMRFISSLL